MRADGERGAIAITALFFAVMVAGLSVALLTEVVGVKKIFDRGESNVRALEAAETGIARAEEEIASNRDTGADGIGNLTGSYGGSNFVVTATRDAVLTDQWTLQARGVQGAGGRQVEVRIRRGVTNSWNYGLFARDTIAVSGGVTTDSYDSRLGTYASQATHSDGFGTYAITGGAIGADGAITVTSSEVRGGSNAGPGYATTLAGTGGVTGDTVSLAKAVVIPDTPSANFVTAATVNDNGSWTTTGGTVYNPVNKSLTISGGNTVTLTKKTYFFSKIILSGNSTLKVTGGPVKVYVTDNVDFSGGAVTNTTGLPVNLQIYQQAYSLPVGYTPTVKSATLSGGTASAFTYYGPSTPVNVSGHGEIFGAIAAKSIVAAGGATLHYDVALIDQMDSGHASITRIYWRDLAPPMR
jgi:Tfp pilus assembly protein PilX